MGKKSKAKKEARERYLVIPYNILNLRGIGLCEKVLLAHIYSFGAKGCWQSNATLAEVLMVSPRTVTQYIARLRREKLVQIKCPKGYYRTIWAKAHPEVAAAVQLSYRGTKADKSANHHSRKGPSQCAINGVRPGRNLLPTNNTTTKETKRETIATPSPLPAGGQAPALLKERARDNLARIERLKHEFGKSGKPYRPLTEQQFQQRRQAQLKGLLTG